MTTKTTRKVTDTIQEVAERLILLAYENPLYVPCHETAQKIIRAVEVGGFRNRIKPMTQVEKLIKHMKDIGPISQREAYLEYDIQSFHRRLSDIKQLGYKVVGKPKVNPVTHQPYTRYALEVMN